MRNFNDLQQNGNCRLLILFVLIVSQSLLGNTSKLLCISKPQNRPALSAKAKSSPIVRVKKELYVKHPRPRVAVNVDAYYIGPGINRVEIHTHMWKSDTPMEPKGRYSSDNGRTWSDFQPLPKYMSFEDSYNMHWVPGQPFYDPATKLNVCISLRQMIIKQPKTAFYNQCYSRLSKDLGRTWSEPKQLRYEDGPYFDPNNLLDQSFLNRNQIYQGNNIIRHSNGTLIFCGTGIRIPKNALSPNPEGKKYNNWVAPDNRNIGSACFIGRWNPAKENYNWQMGEPAWVPMSVSGRGLMEAELAELADGRVLVVWRASPTEVTPGRKFYSISSDGGITLTPVKELRYDDGTQFYSPSSFHRMIRHSVTRKLYWVGNIAPQPPRGPFPRYPLVIAEVNETIPALKRNTVTIIDDRQPGEAWGLQLSNFSLLENRETHDFEIYLTRMGTMSPKEKPFIHRFVDADAYKYTLSLN